MSADPNAQSPTSVSAHHSPVPHDRLLHLSANILFLSFVLGRLANQMRWSMHQHLLTGRRAYSQIFDDAYCNTKIILNNCIASDGARSFSQSVEILVDDYIQHVTIEEADDCWYYYYGDTSWCPNGTMPDGSPPYRYIYDGLRMYFGNAFSLVERLKGTLKSHPSRTPASDHAYDLGFHLDQFIRPDRTGFHLEEQIIVLRSSTIEVPGSQYHNWEQYKQLLLGYALELGIPSSFFDQLSTDYATVSAQQRHATVELTATNLCNWFCPQLLIEARRESALLEGLASRYTNAYRAFRYACYRSQEELSLRDAFQWLEENGWPHGSQVLESFENFRRYMGEVRRLLRNNHFENVSGNIHTQNEIDLTNFNHAYPSRRSSS